MKTEAALQKYFKAQAKKHDVLWRKLEWAGRQGAPDVFLLKTGRVMFVELKSPTGKGKLSEKQRREQSRLRNAGATVLTICSKEEVDDIIKDLTAD